MRCREYEWKFQAKRYFGFIVHVVRGKVEFKAYWQGCGFHKLAKNMPPNSPRIIVEGIRGRGLPAISRTDVKTEC